MVQHVGSGRGSGGFLLVIVTLSVVAQHIGCHARVTLFTRPATRPATRVTKPSSLLGELVSSPSLPNIDRLSSRIIYYKSESGIRLQHLSATAHDKDFDLRYNSLTKSIDVGLKSHVNPCGGEHRIKRSESGTADLVIGLFNAGSLTYVGLATLTSPCLDLPLTRRIDEVKFLPIESAPSPSSFDQKELDLLYSSFYRHDFYFSQHPLSHDITRTTQGNEQLHLLYADKLSSSDGSWSNRAKFPSTFRGSDSRFFWNKVTVQPLVAAIMQQNFTNNVRNDMLNTWVIPITSAAISSFAFRLKNSSYSLTLVSRRSRCRQGPRLMVRGIDSSGDVANFVETEQILRMNGREVASFVQVRGSIPLFWEQTDRFMPKPRITLRERYTTEVDHVEAMSTHLRGLYHRYVRRYSEGFCLAECSKVNSSNMHTPSIVLLNLIDKKSSQGDIGRFMIRVLDKIATRIGSKGILSDRNEVTVCNYSFTAINDSSCGPVTFSRNSKSSIQSFPPLSSLRLVWYDFHYHNQASVPPSVTPTSQSPCPKRNILTYIADVVLSNSSFFMSTTAESPERRNQKPHFPWHKQTQIIRTNCVDSLDRTNVVQSEIARFILLRQLQLFDPTLTLQSDIDGLCSSYSRQSDRLPMQLDKQFRKVWERNGNLVSMLYAGTCALKQDFVRKGRITLKGLGKDTVNSARRYFLNLFEDTSRRRGLNMITGNVDDKSDTSTFDECDIEAEEIKAWGQDKSGTALFSNLSLNSLDSSHILFYTRYCGRSALRNVEDNNITVEDTNVTRMYFDGERQENISFLHNTSNAVTKIKVQLSARTSKVIAALD